MIGVVDTQGATRASHIVFLNKNSAGDFEIWSIKPDGSQRSRLVRYRGTGGSGHSQPGIAQQDASAREEIDRQADALLAKTPDPVGKKLAGQSDALSADDAVALEERGPLGVRLGTLLARTLTDYNSSKVSASAWTASTRTRLQQADRTLTGLRQRAGAITDAAVQLELRRFDRVRARALTAFGRLLEAVVAGTDERIAQDLADRRLRSYQAEGRRLGDLMQPYLTLEQREMLERERERR